MSDSGEQICRPIPLFYRHFKGKAYLSLEMSEVDGKYYVVYVALYGKYAIHHREQSNFFGFTQDHNFRFKPIQWKHLTEEEKNYAINFRDSRLSDLNRIMTMPDIKEEFQKLAKEWRFSTGMYSTISEKAKHPAYQEIIEMGESAIPLILEDLKIKPDHWFSALRSITGDNPVKSSHSGKMELMAQDWIEWGRVRGYCD